MKSSLSDSANPQILDREVLNPAVPKWARKRLQHTPLQQTPSTATPNASNSADSCSPPPEKTSLLEKNEKKEPSSSLSTLHEQQVEQQTKAVAASQQVAGSRSRREEEDSFTLEEPADVNAFLASLGSNEPALLSCADAKLGEGDQPGAPVAGVAGAAAVASSSGAVRCLTATAGSAGGDNHEIGRPQRGEESATSTSGCTPETQTEFFLLTPQAAKNTQHQAVANFADAQRATPRKPISKPVLGFRQRNKPGGKSKSKTERDPPPRPSVASTSRKPEPPCSVEQHATADLLVGVSQTSNALHRFHRVSTVASLAKQKRSAPTHHCVCDDENCREPRCVAARAMKVLDQKKREGVDDERKLKKRNTLLNTRPKWESDLQPLERYKDLVRASELERLLQIKKDTQMTDGLRHHQGHKPSRQHADGAPAPPPEAALLEKLLPTDDGLLDSFTGTLSLRQILAAADARRTEDELVRAAFGRAEGGRGVDVDVEAGAISSKHHPRAATAFGSSSKTKAASGLSTSMRRRDGTRAVWLRPAPQKSAMKKPKPGSTLEDDASHHPENTVEVLNNSAPTSRSRPPTSSNTKGLVPPSLVILASGSGSPPRPAIGVDKMSRAVERPSKLKAPAVRGEASNFELKARQAVLARGAADGGHQTPAKKIQQDTPGHLRQKKSGGTTSSSRLPDPTKAAITIKRTSYDETGIVCTPSLLRKNSLDVSGKTKEIAAGSSAPPVDEGPAAAAAGQLRDDAGEKMKVLSSTAVKPAAEGHQRTRRPYGRCRTAVLVQLFVEIGVVLLCWHNFLCYLSPEAQNNVLM
eukprot:CAMPEP_0178992500 /NCGR_PEP_ID=MMETSP0795-20121207/6150_1 /TAXON_ID=88552 /ORGANISM="Amoebophrya sp., Strain Ameob2" /LENGTH=810 /DNA_ID=CAMNT_0020684391 /DNA_START=249 /DNA_END=2681 /DNA_ORIENTATION=+